MTIQHKDIPTAQLHEPKGAATATAGEVYVADGLGSGSFTNAQSISTGGAAAGAILIADGLGGSEAVRYEGFAQYEDSRITVGTPSQNLSPAARTKWINDGGQLTLEKNPSDLVSSLWNISTNTQQPIALNDVYFFRFSCTCQNYSGATPYLTVEYDIGGGIGTIFETSFTLRKGGAAQQVTVTFPVFVGGAYLANGGEFYVTYNGSGTCDIFRSALLIVRQGKSYI